MKHLRHRLIAAALLAGVGGAFAQQESKLGPYMVAAVGRAQYDYDCWFWSSCDKASANMGKIGGGYRFGVFALEGWYLDFGKATIVPATDALHLRGAAVTGAWYLSMGSQLEGLLRAGAADTRQSRTGDAAKSTLSGYFGLGLVVKLAPATSLELGWDVTGGEGRNSGSAVGSGLTLGLRAHF